MFILICAIVGIGLSARVPRPPHSVTASVPADRSWREYEERGLTDPRNELQTATLQIGPFGPLEGCSPGTDAQRCPSKEWHPTLITPARAGETLEIAFWGDWKIIDAQTKEEIPRPSFYLHHILAYSNSKFITGCSSERTTWGVDDLPYPYRQILRPDDVVVASGFHMNNLAPHKVSFFVQYTIRYKVHVPTDPPVRAVESQYWMDNYNVPGHGSFNSSYARTKDVRFTKDSVIISMNGHMHQGATNLLVRNKKTGEVLCNSRNVYNDAVECYWDCPVVCGTGDKWAAQWATTTCYMEKPVRHTDSFESVAFYDNSCSFRGVMAWWFNWIFVGNTVGGET